jgi:soluble lytic murein transglycosylase-like protein
MKRTTLVSIAIGVVAFLAGFLTTSAACAQVPAQAAKYRGDLVRIAHAAAGLDAPVALFAAQINQESGWNPAATSQVGARGMAQFMPATAKWWCDLHKLSAVDCQPSNPVWAMRALVGYDLWLYERVRGDSEFDRWWAALRAYNGGLGHWQAEAGNAKPATDRAAIDQACGSARRHRSFCPENLGYPRRIMLVLQPRYLSWGSGVQP